MNKVFNRIDNFIDILFHYDKMGTKAIELISTVSIVAFFKINWLPALGGFIVAISLAALQFSKAYKIYVEAKRENQKIKKEP